MNNGGKALTEVGAYTATELNQTLNTVILGWQSDYGR